MGRLHERTRRLEQANAVAEWRPQNVVIVDEHEPAPADVDFVIRLASPKWPLRG